MTAQSIASSVARSVSQSVAGIGGGGPVVPANALLDELGAALLDESGLELLEE